MSFWLKAQQFDGDEYPILINSDWIVFVTPEINFNGSIIYLAQNTANSILGAPKDKSGLIKLKTTVSYELLNTTINADPNINYLDLSNIVNDKSIIFDVLDQGIQISNDNDLAFSKNSVFTIAFWMKTSTCPDDRYIFHRMASNGIGWFLQVTDGLKIKFVMQNISGERIEAITNVSVPPGVWFALIVTYDGTGTASGLKIYYDTTLQLMTIIQDDLSTDQKSLSPTLMIGNSQSLTDGYEGYIDEPIFCNFAMTQECLDEIALKVVEQGGAIDYRYCPRLYKYVTHWFRMGDDDMYPTIRDHEQKSHGIMKNMSTANIVTDVPTIP